MLIRDVFLSEVTRDIPPVVYFHEQSPEKVAAEVSEYIVTGGWPENHPNHRRVPDGIHEQYVRLLSGITEELGKKGGPDLPNAWISGFYGSGKSSFAKLLGLALDGIALPDGMSLADAWLRRDTSPKAGDLAKAWHALRQKIDPLAVVFDVGGVARDNEHVHAVAVRQLQRRLGYCTTEALVAEFELKLERDGEWTRFDRTAVDVLGAPWGAVKDKALAEEDFSRVMSVMFPEHYTDPMSWFTSRGGTHAGAAAPEDAASAIRDMLKFRRPQATVFFVIDEVSQYVLAHKDRLDRLRAFATALGATLRGKAWLLALGQQKLDEEGGEAFLHWAKDRFPPKLRVHLAATNIRDVVHKRLLQKKPAAEPQLRKLFDDNRPDLKLYAYNCDAITPDEFVEVYPMLPGQIDLILQITSALRARSARAQGDDQAIRGLLQLLGELFRDRKLAEQPLGSLVTLDQVYDVQHSALDSEVQNSMARILNQCAGDDGLLVRAAKGVALLELIQEMVPTDAKLVAQCLYDRVDRGNRIEDLEGHVRSAVSDTWMAGRMYFRGRNIAPQDMGASFATALESAATRLLPDLFPHFVATQVQPAELVQLLDAELSGPSPKFLTAELAILDLDAGRYVPACSGIVPTRVWDYIEAEGGLGGAALLAHFGGPPYGYTPNVVKACVAGLLRASRLKIQPESGGEITAIRDAGVRDLFEKERAFRHLPGFNEDSVRQTPLLELYAAGVRYRKALDTAITEAAAGHVRPDEIAAFASTPGLTLDAADAWLAAHLTGDGHGIAAQFQRAPGIVLDDLLTAGSVFASQVADPASHPALWECLGAWTGLPAAWKDAATAGTPASADDVAFAMASWALCVEYVHDLTRPPVSAQLFAARTLPKPLVETCRTIAQHLRSQERHHEFYRRTADETEALLAEEVEAARAEDLGSIDTFRFEEQKVLSAALDALQGRAWDTASMWAMRRTNPAPGTTTFWLLNDEPRKAVWELVDAAARLGQCIAAAGPRLEVQDSLEHAVETYAARGAAVDHAHRLLEQRRAALLYPQLPEFETVRARLDDLRAVWRAWADAWARDFNALCLRHGFLPGAALQQRTLFDEVVRPMARESGTTALFVVDAFRYEMGKELLDEIEGTPATTVHLKARLAELPTVTAVGMNALAPVSVAGRLQPVMPTGNDGGITGFSTGEFRVIDPETRQRAMRERVGGATCPWLDLSDVVNLDARSLQRKIAQARLVVVHSQEIDDSGEKNVGPAVFDHVMQKLRAAWHLLRDAGVRRFVFTSDHGFLLHDETATPAQVHGRRIDPSRRHVISPVVADHANEVRVPLADLGYEGATGHLMFPVTTTVFDTGRRRRKFVHGGNSLQERVIPVLTVVHRAAAGGSTLQYAIAAEPRDPVAGMHCLDVTIDVTAQGGLDFGGSQEVALALRVPGAEDVQVELCQTRGKARVHGGAVLAPVGERFELFFRLSGPSGVRAQVELYHPSAEADVKPFVPDARFEVTPARMPAAPAAAPVPETLALVWLESLPDGARQVFQHLAAHGAITEAEAAGMLGGARGLRRFTLQFETFARNAPFAVRIDVVAGVKRYVREGRNE